MYELNSGKEVCGRVDNARRNIKVRAVRKMDVLVAKQHGQNV